MKRLKSFLFVPADQPAMIAKAFRAGADAVIIDLEDAVADAGKAAARMSLSQYLQDRDCVAGCRVFVRINAAHTAEGQADLAAISDCKFDGLFLPKVDDPDCLAGIAGLLARNEGFELVPMIESASGLENCRRIAAASQWVRRLALGGVDYQLDMNFLESCTSKRSAESGLAFARASLAHASRLTGLIPPVDAPWTTLSDTQGCRESAERARGLGFHAKLCVHPAQVPVVNEVFTPGPQAVEWARKVVVAFEGTGCRAESSMRVEGEMVDYAVYRRSKQLLADC